jgi:amino acid adenylation domain-containing protein
MPGETLVEILEAGLRRAAPFETAVAGAGDALTHGALHAGARGIAARLAEAGVGRGDRVGLWMEKTPACLQALLGVLYAGAAYVPLDPRSPWQRCRTIARDGALAAVVADQPRLERLPDVLEGLSPRLVLVHGAGPRPAAPGLPVEPLEAAVTWPGAEGPAPAPDDLAYVLYTSGSTGVPKGVAHTHRSGAAFVRWVVERFGIGPDDVFSSHAPFHFDLSISDLFAPLGCGGSIRLLSATEGMLAPYLVEGLDRWGITVWYSVPSVLVAMLETGGLEARPPRALRTLFFAGEVFPIAQLRRLRRALPGVRLANLFGPTETNVCTWYEVPADLPDDRVQPVPIGKACEHMETFVLGDDGREIVAPGVEGTLWAKGGNLMAGYWNDPARTAAVLAPDPRGGPGLACNTGDRVRLLPDGDYEYRGRRDHMVKTRGYRVELGEIEATLAAHPSVREAVAVPLPDPALGNRIVASVVPRAGADVDARALRSFLGARVPNYMVPASIEVREELPRTSTGKADRTALRGEWELREET